MNSQDQIFYDYCTQKDNDLIKRLEGIPGIGITLNDDDQVIRGQVLRAFGRWNRIAEETNTLKIWAVVYENPEDFGVVNPALRDALSQNVLLTSLIKSESTRKVLEHFSSSVPQGSRYIHVQDLKLTGATDRQISTGSNALILINKAVKDTKKYVPPTAVAVWSTLAAGNQINIQNLSGFSEFRSLGIIPTPKEKEFESYGPPLIRDLLAIVTGKYDHKRL